MKLKPGYKQTEVGVIPEDWDIGSLECFWSVTDCKHITAAFVPVGIPIVSIREVQSRFVNLTNAKQTTYQFYLQLIDGGRKPQPGDLIISRNATVGEIAQVTDKHPLFAMGQDVCLIRKRCLHYSTSFVQATFQSALVGNQFNNLLVGSTFKRVNVEQIRGLTIAMPPPTEQHVIAEALSDVDGLLEALDRLIAKKRDIKQAAMQQLLTGKTRLPGFKGKWVERKLGDLSRLSKIAVVPSATPDKMFVHFSLPAFDEGEVPVIESGKHIESNKFIVPNQAILVSKLNPRIPRIWAPERIPSNSICSTEFLVLEPLAGIDRSFLKYLCLSPMVCAQMETHAIGTTGSHQRIQPKQAMSIMVQTAADQAEQTAIANVFSDMDAEIATLEQRREKTRLLKQGMMQELLTGRTRLVNLKRPSESRTLDESENDVLGKVNYDELIRLELVCKAKSNLEKTDEICRLTASADLNEFRSKMLSACILVAAFKDTRQKVNTMSMGLWIWLGMQAANKITTAKYSRKKLTQCVRKFQNMTEQPIPDVVWEVRKELLNAGVALVIVPIMDQSALRGGTRLVSEDKAIIIHSLKYKNLSQFWIILFHEIAHLLLHLEKPGDIVVDYSDASESREENEATEWALETLVPRKLESEFLSTHPSPTHDDLIAYAKRVGVHPSVAAEVLNKRNKSGKDEIFNYKELNLAGLLSYFSKEDIENLWKPFRDTIKT